ncbi:MAG: cyclase family protein [Lachnospiraceae bacterium]|nr:cyclase family protein [Lachnospiraceae bacterium]
MKIYDISQEVFGCAVFPGDPAPEREILLKKSEGAVCNLSAFRMCAHNGTHVDAPFHFVNDGKKIDEIAPEQFAGYAYVAAHEGNLEAEDIRRILQTAKEAAQTVGKDAFQRILIKGRAVLTEDAARVLAEHRILLFGNESQTVGPEDAPMAVHLIMLGAGIVLLEGIRLEGVEEGIYLLNALPLNLGGADGAPCRAILIRDL